MKIDLYIPQSYNISWTSFTWLYTIFCHCRFCHWYIPFQFKCKFISARSFIFCTCNYIIEKKKMSQFSMTIRKFYHKRIFYQSSLCSIMTLKIIYFNKINVIKLIIILIIIIIYLPETLILFELY